MTTRRKIAVVMIVAALISPCAFAQISPVGEPANDVERALIGAQPNAWAQLNLQQRQRVLENFRQWQRMTPEQRERAQRNFQEFRKLPPEERQQVVTHAPSVAPAAARASRGNAGGILTLQEHAPRAAATDHAALSAFHAATTGAAREGPEQLPTLEADEPAAAPGV